MNFCLYLAWQSLVCLFNKSPLEWCKSATQALGLAAAIAPARQIEEGAAPPLPYDKDPLVRSLQNNLAFGLHHWGELGSPLAKLSNASWSFWNSRINLVLPDVRIESTTSSGIQKATAIADTYAKGVSHRHPLD